MYHDVIHAGVMHDRRHRQERWLHTRISEDLEDALKREARRRRTPVSLVVRHVLEGALDLVEDIVADSLEVARRSGRLAKTVQRPRRGVAPDGLADIYGWQELILNRTATCAQCDTALAIGANVYRGLREHSGGAPIFLCTTCVRRLHRSHSDEKEGPR